MTASRGASRPTPVIALAVFFATAAAFSLVVAAALAAPSSPLAVVWRMKPEARPAFVQLGVLGVLLMLVLAAATALTARGLWIGARWGWWLAILVLAGNGLGDLVRAVTTDPRSGVAVLIVAAAIVALAREPSRRWCRRAAS